MSRQMYLYQYDRHQWIEERGSTPIEKRKEIDSSRCRQTWFVRLLVSRFNKQKEEVHGNEFDRNFERCGGKKLLAGSSGRFGTLFLRAGFPVCCPQSLHQANHRLFGFSRRALGLDRGSAFRCGGHRRRPQHFAGLSRKTWRLAHRAVPDSGHLDVAQVLDGSRPDDGADTNDSVHEKCLHARRRPADFSLRSRTVQFGCTTLALNAPNKRREPNAQPIRTTKSCCRQSTDLTGGARSAISRSADALDVASRTSASGASA